MRSGCVWEPPFTRASPVGAIRIGTALRPCWQWPPRAEMKIAIIVQGRFHAFDLTRALSERGHQVTLFTNYPQWAARRFGIGDAEVRSFWPHGVASRVAGYLGIKAEPLLH